MTLLSSSPKLRKRMDARVPEMFDFVALLIDSSLGARRSDYGVQPCGWLPLDVDTFAMDNGGTAKEGVGRTYAGVDGYCPLAAYLGSHGFCLELALRPGLKHSASETDFNLERVIPLARRLSAAGRREPMPSRSVRQDLCSQSRSRRRSPGRRCRACRCRCTRGRSRHLRARTRGRSGSSGR